MDATAVAEAERTTFMDPADRAVALKGRCVYMASRGNANRKMKITGSTRG
jgi:hypothetical protein